MKNVLINNLHQKDVEHCTTDLGLNIRKKSDKAFKKLCNIFTNANIIKNHDILQLSDEEYFFNLSLDYIPIETYNIKKGKNNIIVERYPKLEKDKPYIFVCNHTCPEDIETVLNILDRNAYLILGSIESLQYNPEMYLSYLNGMIPFDIMDKNQRKLVFEKMKRVIDSNSILIFPEGSHNYSPNKIVNNLFDGPVNLALQTKREIVIITMIKDNDNNISYVDVGNPIDVASLNAEIDKKFQQNEEINKYYVNKLSSIIRDKMATAVFHIMQRHFKVITRKDYQDIEEYLRMQKIKDAFQKLKWKNDVFDAEYLTKKTTSENEYENVVNSISNLTINPNSFLGLGNREWILKKNDIDNKDIVNRMREYWLSNNNEKRLKK